MSGQSRTTLLPRVSSGGTDQPITAEIRENRPIRDRFDVEADVRGRDGVGGEADLKEAHLELKCDPLSSHPPEQTEREISVLIHT